MKIAKKITFIISILLPLAITVFVGFYTFGAIGNWTVLQTKFIQSVFDKEGDTVDRIEEYVRFNTSHYYNSLGNLKVIEDYTVSDYEDITYVTPTNGYYLSADGSFKLRSYSVANAADDEFYAVNHTFFLYDVDHLNIKPDNLYFICVRGNDANAFENINRGIKQFTEKYIENKSATGGTAKTTLSGQYAIYDTNAKYTPSDDYVPYAYCFTPYNDYILYDENGTAEQTTTTSFSQLQSCTFAIIEYISGDNPNTSVKMVASLSKIDKTPEAVTRNADVQLGYGTNSTKALVSAGYVKFVWPRILLYCSLTLVVSGLVCYLFYATWSTEDPDESKLKIPTKK